MNEAERLSSDKNLKDIADYFSLDKIIEEEKRKGGSETKNNVKIAILSSFTSRGLKEVLNVKCHQLNIASEFYTAPYNQYMQEILNKESALYKFNPDIIFIFVDIKSLLGEHFYFPYRLSATERKNLIEGLAGELNTILDCLRKSSKARIILHNFEVPVYSPMGILENKASFGLIEAIESLNDKLRDSLRDDSRFFLFDYNAFCSRYGKRNICDPKMYYLADMKLHFSYIMPLCENYLSYIKPLLNISRKCLVLDLDNTLWGGVIGEDGLQGIRLGPDNESKAYLEFQKYILSLHERGVILAINSNNNPSDVFEVFEKHPYMILKEKHFATLKINWDDKISNMKAIAQEINIGLDSLVFIDDDKLNREMIKNALPEVLVVDLPDDSSLYPEMLLELNDFNLLQITEEDKKRGQMYAEQSKRTELQKCVTDLTCYLKKLDMVVTIEKANAFNIPRISQLTQRTNQFNMTTKRYSVEEIEEFSKSDSFLVVSIKVEDKFGDNGITGLAILDKKADAWRIDSFLLSCRIIGRKVEETLLAYILEQAKKEKAKILTGEFIHTKKNSPAKDFYKNNGFSLVKNENEIEVWRYGVEKGYKYPDFIQIIKKG